MIRKPIELIHDLTFRNKELVELSGTGICINCNTHSFSKFITYTNDDSALCPSCKLDSVVPEVNTKIVTLMRKIYFEV